MTATTTAIRTTTSFDMDVPRYQELAIANTEDGPMSITCLFVGKALQTVLGFDVKIIEAVEVLYTRKNEILSTAHVSIISNITEPADGLALVVAVREIIGYAAINLTDFKIYCAIPYKELTAKNQQPEETRALWEELFG